MTSTKISHPRTSGQLGRAYTNQEYLRSVRRPVREIQKEGAVLVGLDHLHRLVGVVVREVAAGRDAGRSRVVGIALAVEVVVGVPGGGASDI